MALALLNLARMAYAFLEFVILADLPIWWFVSDNLLSLVWLRVSVSESLWLFSSCLFSPFAPWDYYFLMTGFCNYSLGVLSISEKVLIDAAATILYYYAISYNSLSSSEFMPPIVSKWDGRAIILDIRLTYPTLSMQ